MKVSKQHIKLTMAMVAAFLFVGTTAFAQCEKFENFPGGVDEGKKTHVLYVDYMKQDPPNFKEAMPLWEKVYEHAPAGHVRHFTDGVKIYKNLIKNEEDATKKAALIETLWSIYDKRIACMGKEGYVLGRKAYNMYFLSADPQKTLETFARSIELEDNKSSDYVISTYSKVYVNDFIKIAKSADDAKKTEARNLNDKLQAIARHNIANPRKESDKAKYEKALTIIEEQFTKIGLYIFDCEFYKKSFAHEFDETRFNSANLGNLTKQDREVWMSTYRKLQSGGCTATDPLLQKINSFDSKWKAMYQESQVSTKQHANRAVKNGNYPEAIKLYNQAIGETGDNSEKADLNMRIAKILYSKQKQRSEARTYARKAAKLKPNWGEPFILIGEMYASSGPVCGKGTGWDSQTVVWAAIDKWQYAKSIDPNVAEEANRLIARYTQYMPTKEDIFQRNLKSGKSYKVGCWIQESTTIRGRKQY